MVTAEQSNIASLGLVKSELLSELNQAATKLEHFIGNGGDESALLECTNSLRQVEGTLRLIQLSGAEVLAADALGLVENYADWKDEDREKVLGLLTGAFFILPRYVEYCLQNKRLMPVLLIPYINEIRQYCRNPLMPEGEYLVATLDSAYPRKKSHREMAVDDLGALTRRLRHMYQVGLLNILKGQQVKSGLGLMQRAMERLQILSGDRPKTALWGLSAAALDSLRSDNMDISMPRKRLLMMLEREIKAAHNLGMACFEQPPAKSQIQQLLFVIAVSSQGRDSYQELLQAYQVQLPDYTEADLRREMDALRGPNLSTVSSVVTVVTEELKVIQDTLERAVEVSLLDQMDPEEIRERAQRVADALTVIGLALPAQALRQEIIGLAEWKNRASPPAEEELAALADTLLYVESAVSNLVNPTDLNVVSSRGEKDDRREVMRGSLLREAQHLVLQECEGALSLVKRAMSAFAESAYEDVHISNVAATLNSIRGGVEMMGLTRAADILRRCGNFIKNSLCSNFDANRVEAQLQTFADAIVGLEYYFEALIDDNDADDSVLGIAEESLSALGY